jgi:hypothetical protein
VPPTLDESPAFMMTRVTKTCRIVPPRLGAIAGLALSVWALSLIAWLGFWLGATFPWPFIPLTVLFILLAAQSTSQLLPSCPTDYVEAGSDGLTVGGL